MVEAVQVGHDEEMCSCLAIPRNILWLLSLVMVRDTSSDLVLIKHLLQTFPDVFVHWTLDIWTAEVHTQDTCMCKYTRYSHHNICISHEVALMLMMQDMGRIFSISSSSTWSRKVIISCSTSLVLITLSPIFVDFIYALGHLTAESGVQCQAEIINPLQTWDTCTCKSFFTHLITSQF